MTSFSPREIVSELDRFIVGQKDAKRAGRHRAQQRWRRQQADRDLKEEVLPKNILMIGPTGCGKTEISRRCQLAGAPFLKVEATKFTEVGYVGRDVDSIVRDLVEVGIGLMRETQRREVKAQAEKNAEERVLDALVGPALAGHARSFRKRLRSNELNDKEIEIQVAEVRPAVPTFDIPGGQVGMINLNDMLGKAFGQRTKPRSSRRAGLRHPDRAGERQAARPGPGACRRRSSGRERRHRVPRRDRQDLRALGGRTHRRRRVARGRAARPAAADRGHHGVDQVRAGEDRPRAVHRLGRLPQRQAVRPAAELQGRLPIRVELKPLTTRTCGAS
jgi:ATP-dependent protease HslVU (ClpYQ) ATPase subunit